MNHSSEEFIALNKRLETLELKFMDLENTTQALNDVILKQYRDIETLQMQQNELLHRMNASQAADGERLPKPDDEIPPHY